MSNLKIGDFCILDECDAPEARMVIELTRYDDVTGTWHGRYLSTFPNMTECYTTAWMPTLVSDFGVDVEFNADRTEYRCVPTGEPSKARYEDGLPRHWQDRNNGVWRSLRLPKRPEEAA